MIYVYLYVYISMYTLHMHIYINELYHVPKFPCVSMLVCVCITGNIYYVCFPLYLYAFQSIYHFFPVYIQVCGHARYIHVSVFFSIYTRCCLYIFQYV